MWHDTGENFDIGKNEGVQGQNNQAEFVVTFHIDQFLSSKHQIDLSQAKDGNRDGTIEITPKNIDGNKELADQLKDNIKYSSKMMD
jgi:hypothetical protein